VNEIKYLAVPDPANASAMTFWRIGGHGQLEAWPRQADYGPTLWRVPGPGREHVVPAGLKGSERREWIRNWTLTVRVPWMTQVRAAVDADPVSAGATFAALRTCCARCGRSLDDPASRSRALGSDCVQHFPDHLIAALCREVGRAYAAHLAGDEEAALLSRDAAYGDAYIRAQDEERAA
jgi:uncharacterized protein DUF6011